MPTDGTLSETSLKQLLRDVCITTGIEAKPVVLLVAGNEISTVHMLTIAELMCEGINYTLSFLMMSSHNCRSITVIVYTIRTIGDD